MSIGKWTVGTVSFGGGVLMCYVNTEKEKKKRAKDGEKEKKATTEEQTREKERK